MVNKNKLKAKIFENGTTSKKIAEKLGIDISTYYRKLNKSKITVREAQVIAKELSFDTSDILSIFFD